MGSKLELKHVAAPRRMVAFYPSGTCLAIHGALVIYQKGGAWQPAIVSKRLKTWIRMLDPRAVIIDEASHEVLFDPREVPNDEQAAWVLRWLQQNPQWPGELFEASPTRTQRRSEVTRDIEN